MDLLHLWARPAVASVAVLDEQLAQFIESYVLPKGPFFSDKGHISQRKVTAQQTHKPANCQATIACPPGSQLATVRLQILERKCDMLQTQALAI